MANRKPKGKIYEAASFFEPFYKFWFSGVFSFVQPFTDPGVLVWMFVFDSKSVGASWTEILMLTFKSGNSNFFQSFKFIVEFLLLLFIHLLPASRL